MPIGVHYVPLGIELNLSLPDLGHPDIPDLREQVLAEPAQVGIFQCVHYARGDVCNSSTSTWMYLKGRDTGDLSAAHYPRSADPADGTPESDLHKALKERAVRTAEREGFATETEQDLTTPTGTYRPDVLIRADDHTIACEAQVSYATDANIDRRTARARSIGIAPLWTTHDPNAGWIGRAPWQYIITPGREDDWRYVAGQTDIIAQGVRTLTIEECGRRGPCTHRGARRPCPGRQAFWDPNRSTFDRILIAMAKQWLVGAPIDGNWWLIPVPDRDRYLELGGQLVERQPRRPALHTGTPRPIEAHCTFGVDTGARAAPRPRLDRTGPLTATIPEPRTAAPAAVERPARRACQPCVYGCPEPAQLYPCGWRCDTHRPQRSGT